MFTSSPTSSPTSAPTSAPTTASECMLLQCGSTKNESTVGISQIASGETLCYNLDTSYFTSVAVETFGKKCIILSNNFL